MGTYLGVDGGGTKTAFVLVDEDLRVLAEAAGPSCYALPADPGLVERVLSEGVAALGVDAAAIDRAFFALPGYGESGADVPVLDRVPGAVLGHRRYSVGNDMVAGWAGSLGGADGINVVAGTGSIAYGAWAGRSARSGGWSELFGDDGSAFWIAVRGLNAFSRMSDGRLPRGPLHARLREALGATADFDVISVVVGEWSGDRTRVAALSRVVVAAADEGDAAARAIVADAGRELARLAHAIRSTLAVPAGEVCPVSYSGGVFAAPAVLAAFDAALGDGHRLVEPIHRPVIGAALLAVRAATG